MNSTVAKLFLIIYVVVFILILNSFLHNQADLSIGVGGMGFGTFLSPIPATIVDLFYAFFLTNFLLLLVNTFMAIKVQFVSFFMLFIAYGILMIISNLNNPAFYS